LLKSKDCVEADLYGKNMGDDEAKQVAEWLKGNKTLTTLNVGWNNIGADGAGRIADALLSNSSLTTLNVGWNNIGDDGAGRIADALQTNTTVTSLNLHNNNISSPLLKSITEMISTNIETQKQIKKEIIFLVGWCLKSRKIPVDVINQLKSFLKPIHYRHLYKVVF